MVDNNIQEQDDGAAASFVDQTVQCLCGAVEFRVQGKLLFSELCHCRACSWAASVSPVHLVGVAAPTISYAKNASSEDHIRVTKGLGKMTHARCTECMAPVYQKPAGANFVALFPPTFYIGNSRDSVEQKLPAKYLPQYHANYENRTRDYADSIPKYKTFPSLGNEMNNDGTLKTK